MKSPFSAHISYLFIFYYILHFKTLNRHFIREGGARIWGITHNELYLDHLAKPDLHISYFIHPLFYSLFHWTILTNYLLVKYIIFLLNNSVIIINKKIFI